MNIFFPNPILPTILTSPHAVTHTHTHTHTYIHTHTLTGRRAHTGKVECQQAEEVRHRKLLAKALDLE